MFNGKIRYKWPFSIAMLNYQRVSEAIIVISRVKPYFQWLNPAFDHGTWETHNMHDVTSVTLEDRHSNLLICCCEVFYSLRVTQDVYMYNCITVYVYIYMLYVYQLEPVTLKKVCKWGIPPKMAMFNEENSDKPLDNLPSDKTHLVFCEFKMCVGMFLLTPQIFWPDPDCSVAVIRLYGTLAFRPPKRHPKNLIPQFLMATGYRILWTFSTMLIVIPMRPLRLTSLHSSPSLLSDIWFSTYLHST